MTWRQQNCLTCEDLYLAVSRKEADRVYDLPGLTFDAKFGQYSGYLNGVKGNYIKYWLAA